MNDRIGLTMDDLEAVSGGAGAGGEQPGGFFVSNTGTGLNIRVDWSVSGSSFGGKTLNVQVSTVSYSLNSIALPGGVEVTANHQTYVAESAAVNYGGSSQISTLLASFSIPNLSGSVQLSAVWHFNGTYSGVALHDISASGNAYV